MEKEIFHIHIIFLTTEDSTSNGYCCLCDERFLVIYAM